MIKDYKGEMPKNVTTPEKAKAKKPFYKDWKFWVLTGLMTLFGACSIYGLVLGSQYVQAIERASHIIADAQGSEAQSKSLKNNRLNALDANSIVKAVDLGTLSYTTPNENGWTRSIDPLPYAIAPENNSTFPSVVCDAFVTSTPNGVWTTSGTIGLDTTGSVIIRDDLFLGISRTEVQSVLSGHYIFYRATQGITAEENFYNEGYSDGYDEGYSDGSDAINVNQSVKVLLPAGSENSCSFVTYLDGVPDQQGILSSSSSFGAYGEFARNRNQKLRIDLTLPSGSRAFFMYVPHWTSAYPSDENYSLRQSWAVSGVTYLPTWVSKPEIYVGITSALVDDLTYDTISVAFDVDHWGDVKVGAYQEGYQQGYVDGQQDPTAYQSGYDAGYSDGERQGETDGFNRGVAVGSSGSQSLAMMFKTAFQLPFDQLYRFLNFNLLGINFLSLFTALISVSIGIIVIKKVL